MELYGLTQKGQHLDFELSQIGGTYETEDGTITVVNMSTGAVLVQTKTIHQQSPADVPEPIDLTDNTCGKDWAQEFFRTTTSADEKLLAEWFGRALFTGCNVQLKKLHRDIIKHVPDDLHDVSLTWNCDGSIFVDDFKYTEIANCNGSAALAEVFVRLYNRVVRNSQIGPRLHEKLHKAAFADIENKTEPFAALPHTAFNNEGDENV